jgi:hypothetical protein
VRSATERELAAVDELEEPGERRDPLQTALVVVSILCVAVETVWIIDVMGNGQLRYRLQWEVRRYKARRELERRQRIAEFEVVLEAVRIVEAA